MTDEAIFLREIAADWQASTPIMTAPGQTHREALSTMSPTLNPKQQMKIATWNTRTMAAPGRVEQVCKEMHRYNIDIMGVCEARLKNAGKKIGPNGEMILFSGNESRHERGVAIIIDKKTKGSLMEWTPVSDRVLKARFFSRHIKLTIILAYAPTNEAEDDEKESFYNQLDDVTLSVPRHDLLMVIGDFNAKVGISNEGYEDVMGRNGIGTRNENGELFLDFCKMHGVVVGGTLFPHRDIHKVTWNSPAGYRNQIDHIAVSRRFKLSLLDVRNKRGADVASDHELVVARVRLKLATLKKPKGRKRRYDVGKLKQSEISDALREEINRRLVIQEDGSIEENWKSIKEALNSASEYVLGFQERKKAEWMTDSTWEKIDQRKQLKSDINNAESDIAKEELQDEYRAKHVEVKREIKNDKQNFMDGIAEKAQGAADRGEISTLYKLTNQICSAQDFSCPPVKDKSGRPLGREADQLIRWRQHFEEVLNRDEPDDPVRIEERNYVSNINIQPPTKEEIRACIKQMSKGKAPGLDNINAEVLTCNAEELSDKLTPFFKKIWHEEQIPEDWKKTVIIKIPKKGDRSVCDNWRGISLLSIPSKIYCKIIYNRVRIVIDEQIRSEQTGFRRGKGCVNQIFILKNIIEQCNEWKHPLLINFIDFEKAFDSIHLKSLWKILTIYHLPEKIINQVKQFYTDRSCTVEHEGTLTEWFAVKSGVRQGCVLSGFLFLLVIDWVMVNTNKRKRGLPWGPFKTLEDLDFADDLAVFAVTRRSAQHKLDGLSEIASRCGLKINPLKTQSMVIHLEKEPNLTTRGKEIQMVDHFKYLGSIVSADGSSTKEIKERVRKARTAFFKLRNFWKSGQYRLNTKIKIFHSNVMPVLLYGSECWTINQSDGTRLNAFLNMARRWILGYFWPRKVSNEEMDTKIKISKVTDIIKQRRWRWIGHILRMAPGSNERIALTWTPPGKRKKGRPRTTWRRMVEEERGSMGWSTWGLAAEAARSKAKWRAFVKALCISKPMQRTA